MYPKKTTEKANGNCFVVAASIAGAFADRLFLMSEPGVSEGIALIDDELVAKYDADIKSVRCVHGSVTRPLDGRRHTHAWVEIDLGEKMNHLTVMVDYSNGQAVNIPRQYYYELGEIDHDEVRRYTPEETLKQMVRSEHWGPWDDIFEEAA